MNKIRLKQILKFSGFTFAGLFLISLITSVFVVWQISSQLGNSKAISELRQGESLQKLHTQLKILDLATSNPVMAVGASIVITPSTYADLSSAIGSSKELVGITKAYLAENREGKDSLVSIAAPLETAMPYLNDLFATLSQIQLAGVLTPFDERLNQVRSKSQELHLLSKSLTPITSILPSLVGSEEPRKYLMAFQNSAEARGTGGILGAYAVITADKGKISFTEFGSNAALAQLQDIPIQMPEEYVRLYNDDPGIWQNSNLSPHFPYGAKIWLALWERQYGQRLDGVVTFDPIALSYLLRVTGPVIANGEEINSDNVVKVTLSDLYQKYQTNNEARKIFLINIIKAVSVEIEEGNISLLDLASELIQPLNEHRMLIYSDKAKEQKIIENSLLSGAVSEKADNDYRLIIQNTSGNKMDYYLERKLRIESIECGRAKRTKVTFTVKNAVSLDLKLPSYVMGRLDLKLFQGLNNSYGTRAIILAPIGARIVEAKDLQTGEKFGFLLRERGHLGIGVQVDLAAGESESFTVTFSGGEGKLTTHVQPLVIPQESKIIDKCSTS